MSNCECRIATGLPIRNSKFASRNLKCTGVAQPGRGTGLRNQLMRVRIPPPVPQKLRMSNCGFRIAPGCQIRDSPFEILFCAGVTQSVEVTGSNPV